jgi:putative spermidine/putrescine transport system ATP-binding protein
VTTINVTHDQREALVMSDEIVVMDAGRVQQVAAPAAIYHRPENRFVAGFIGVTNLLRGRVTAVSGGRAVIRIGSLDLSAPTALGTEIVGRDADLVLRAEQLHLGRAAERLAACDTAIEATVGAVIFEGDRLVYEVRCAALDQAVLRVFDNDPRHSIAFALGDAVTVGWSDVDPLLFLA